MIELCKILIFLQIMGFVNLVVETGPDLNRNSTSLTISNSWTTPGQPLNKSLHYTPTRSEEQISTRSNEHITESFEQNGIITEDFSIYTENDPCYFYGTCEFTVSRDENERFCHCDERCAIFGDCCVDSGVQPDIAVVDNRYGCHRIKFDEMFQNVGIFVVDKCDAAYDNTEISRKCLQNLTLSGPFVSDQHGTVFKNQFCAECNFADNISFFQLRISQVDLNFLNQKTLKLEDVLSLPKTQYEMSPTNDLPLRACIVLDNTAETNLHCEAYYINPHLVLMKKMYRNYLCPTGEKDLDVYCYGYYLEMFGGVYSPRDLTVMFSFSSNQQSSCWASVELCHGEPIIENYGTVLRLRLDTELKMTSSFLDAVLAILINAITVPDQIYITEGRATDASVGVSSSSYFVYLTLKLVRPFSITQMSNVEQPFEEFTFRSNIHFHESNEIKTIFVFHSKQPLVENLSEVWTFNIDNQFAQYEEFPLDQMDIKYNSKTMWDSFCSNIVMNCSTEGNFIQVEDVACLAANETAGVDVHVTYAKVVITYVGCSLSIFTLLVSVILSRKLNIYKSVTGNNFENMSASLCISNLLFMLGIGLQDYQLLCYITGILLQYFWLCCFSFMSIATVYIRKGITSMEVSSTKLDKTGTRCLLSITGVFIPLLFVVPSILLDLLGVPGFYANYAGSVCFPTGFLTNTLLFTCPIILSMIINFLSLVHIILYVARHNKEMENVRKSALAQHAQVYLRVCSFSGVFWITGIIGAFFKSDVVDYVFIVLCSFQGMGVAIANLTTKTVVNGLSKSKSQAPTLKIKD